LKLYIKLEQILILTPVDR